MKAPQLNRKLTLEAPQRTPDGAGGFTESWQALGTLWADVRLRTGREAAGEAMAVSKTSYRITLRAAPLGAEQRPKPEQRLREGARLFHIKAVAEADCQGRYLVCFAEEELVA